MSAPVATCTACRILLSDIRGYYTEARRYEVKQPGSEAVAAAVYGNQFALHQSDMKLTLYPPTATGGGSGLWTVSGTGKDRDSSSTVNGIYNPSTGR